MKMDDQFGANITQKQLQNGVMPHVIIPKHGLKVEEKDALLSSLPINTGHLMMADKNLSFLLALISTGQKKSIQINPNIKYVGEVSIDINALTLLVKDGMQILSNPNIAKDV